MAEISVRALSDVEIDAHLDALAEILAETVKGGGAVSFVQPFSPADGKAFYRDQVWSAVREDERVLLAAFGGGGFPVGSVQLVVGLPPNQPHRCEVAKMMVHPRHRGRGVAKRLMAALEAEARRRGQDVDYARHAQRGRFATPLRRVRFQGRRGNPGVCVGSRWRAPARDDGHVQAAHLIGAARRRRAGQSVRAVRAWRSGRRPSDPD